MENVSISLLQGKLKLLLIQRRRRFEKVGPRKRVSGTMHATICLFQVLSFLYSQAGSRDSQSRWKNTQLNNFPHSDSAKKTKTTNERRRKTFHETLNILFECMQKKCILKSRERWQEFVFRFANFPSCHVANEKSLYLHIKSFEKKLRKLNDEKFQICKRRNLLHSDLC